MNPTEAGVLGILLPVLIAFLKREHFSNAVNGAIALVVYVVAGAFAVLLSGTPVDVDNLVPTISIIAAAGTIAYAAFWSNWGDPQIQAKLAAPVAP
ncbi:MAG: hypothetical protein ACRDGQ_06770 [Candidatus Limnocylindrales bacterium]